MADRYGRVPITWARWFCKFCTHDYFVDIELDFLKNCDVGEEVPDHQRAYDMITFDMKAKQEEFIPETDEDETEDYNGNDMIKESAIKLYGLIHAQYIFTDLGMEKMKKKYLNATFGRCPNKDCNGQLLIPLGLTQNRGKGKPFCHCINCKENHPPETPLNNDNDIAFFGVNFHNEFFVKYPELLPRQAETPVISSDESSMDSKPDSQAGENPRTSIE